MVGCGSKSSTAMNGAPSELLEPSGPSKDGSLPTMGQPTTVETVTRKLQKGLSTSESEKRHLFWETQPLGQYQDASGAGEGPIEASQLVSKVRQEPYNLPSTYEWCSCNLTDEQTMKEVYTLLSNNCMEDDNNMFRFDYSVALLRWALNPPGYFPSWHIGVMAWSSKKLVAFITGIPARIQAHEAVVPMAEISFLCVHKKLRSKWLAPVFIREVTRRVHLEDMWQYRLSHATIGIGL